jgi:hypothetical protein
MLLTIDGNLYSRKLLSAFLRLNEVSPLEHLMATFDQFVSSIRQEFGEQGAGKKFEVFCKWFLENDPEWSKKVDKVWLWDEYPNKWHAL